MCGVYRSTFFLYHEAPPTYIYTLSLHDALPIYVSSACRWNRPSNNLPPGPDSVRWHAEKRPGPDHLHCRSSNMRARQKTRRSEEHTSELQSQFHLVCRLLLEKKNHTSIAMSPST